MAESRRYALGAQLDIEQILLEAQHRWLRPAEICEILRNYQKFRIAPEPPNRPPSGSLFLFDRKVLRYFRKDGHNWRKKKDGKTVKEAHERLKAGSIDVLHCYYAHGEDDENFQRRSYWMLEEELSHIVLVHYREVKGNRTNYNRVREIGEAIPNAQESEDDAPNSEFNSNSTSKFHSYGYQVTSQITDTVSLNSAQASEYEDAESAYTQQSTSGFHTFLEIQPPVLQKAEGRPVPYYAGSTLNGYQGQFSGVPDVNFASIPQGEKDQSTTGAGLSYMPEGHLDFPSWGNVLDSRNGGYQSVNFQPSVSATQHGTINVMPGGMNDILGQALTDGLGKRQDSDAHVGGLEQWQTSEVDASSLSKCHMDQKLNLPSGRNLSTSFNEVNNAELPNSSETFSMHKSPIETDVQVDLIRADSGISAKSAFNGNLGIEGKAEYPTLRQPLLDGVLKEGLKKLDSFDRWMSRELGDVNESHIQSSSGTYWETVGNDDGLGDSNIAPQVHIDSYMMSPSIAQDQLFSIIDFSPNWAYSGSEMKVLIMGRFLKSQEELGKYKWACMFGEVEVQAEVIANGALRCLTPLHEAGRVPFYVTCSNRLACSEVREFEFRVSNVKDDDVALLTSGIIDECHLLTRFGKLLTTGSHNYQDTVPGIMDQLSTLRSKIESLVINDNNEWEGMLNLTLEEFSVDKVKDQLLVKLLKDRLYLWLRQKVAEGGKGPSMLDEGGQGVLHLAAALGYDWALSPTIAAGVSVNFRDLNGWTALHWAASFGRERTVALLISLGASPGALTDPTPKYPSGIPPAELASNNGHKGIAGYLAESTLSSHLSSLKVKDDKEGYKDDKADYNGEGSGANVVQTASERTATPIADGDLPVLSLKDSLAAVRNATQAHARIHQVFRVQSFQRKQQNEYGSSGLGISDERALSLLSAKTKRAGQRDEPVHAAATQIQNKFRSWKGRKEFLQKRQQIIKIQAHVRGHQVRKNYRSIIWSVGILEKVILRWRRKGSGLRGFKPEAPPVETSIQGSSSKEDDYDFLKEGRKQTENQLQKALARVKSMVQYPEARDQYRRLLNVVSDMQETKAVYDRALDNSDEAADFDEDLIDLDALLDDDPLM
ncbi:calmodulin-binding transcription activator 3-like [Coffea arabica]|uniref:Calmodulin-binding transcription activator 3-like n=1 Tax=Coffea arabica TaxID=13443 RepID=A0A6P6TIC7_COFAR|nr:calmodulin-binding transcription activator 3-like [Coffea arabica]